MDDRRKMRLAGVVTKSRPAQQTGNGTGAGRRQSVLAVLLLLAMGCLCSCDSPPPTSPTRSTVAQPTLAPQMIFYCYKDDLPEEILEGFTKEFGVKVDYQTYEDQDEAIANLQAGKVYDVVVLENRSVPLLVKNGLLAELDHARIPNLKNISANFRDLAHDPGNRYCVPYNWGTTALVVRSDLVAEPVTSWVDLWDPRYAGRVGLWMGQRRDVFGLALKSLGFSANSENVEQLEAALQRLLLLKPHTLTLEDFDPDNSSEVLSSGKVILALGYAKDVLKGRQSNPAITYVMPKEGAMLWGDNFMVPAASKNKATAEVFINYLQRPDVNALIANKNSYATANEKALPLIDPAIRNDQVVFPTNQAMQNAELQLPLSPEGEKLHHEFWQRLVDGEGPGG